MDATRGNRFAKEDIFRDELVEAVAGGCQGDERATFDKLIVIGRAAELSTALPQQRTNVGRGHGLKNEVVQTSKVDIFNTKCQQTAAAEESRKKMAEAYIQLLEIDLPPSKREEMIEMAAQEYVEATFVRTGCPHIFEGKEIPDIPTMKDLDVTPQAYLAGMVDCPTELSKLLTDHLLLTDLSPEEEFQTIYRYVNFVSSLCRFLSLFTGFPPGVVNATTIRGQGLQSSLRRAEEAVYEWKRDLVRLKREKRGAK